MKSSVAIGLALIAIALGIVSVTRPQPSQGKDVVQAAEAYIQDVASQNSLRIENEKVIAYRTTGDDAVVRVLVRYQPYFQITKNRRLYGPTSVVTLIVKLHKGLWTAGSLTAAP